MKTNTKAILVRSMLSLHQDKTYTQSGLDQLAEHIFLLTDNDEQEYKMILREVKDLLTKTETKYPYMGSL